MMKNIYWLVTAAALGIAALITFQVIWMRHSRVLLEEQFNNKVSMALCSAVESVAENSTCTAEMRACCSGSQGGCETGAMALMDKPEMQTALKNALAFHQIDLPYEPHVAPRTNETPFSCSLQPILANDSLQLQLAFKGKNEYFLHRMGFMVAASIGILLFICALFGLALYYLLRQKRMSDKNRDFFNQMTHEFRTPLANIKLASSLLERKTPELTGNQYLGIIRDECGRLTHQVENVLYLAGLEKGDFHLKKEPINLKTLASEVVQSMDLQIREKSAQIFVEDNGPAIPIHGDPFHLRNAFRNLIDNALKYSGNQPQLTIQFQSAADGSHIRFLDNGVGIAPEEQQRVFQKFYRCQNALDTGQKGFGIGLSYVKKIVELHHGAVSLSAAPHSGACFDLYFPAHG